MAPEEEGEVEKEAALEGGSAEASGGGVKTGGHRSRVGAIGGPLEPAAASTTTEGQVHDGASTEVAVQTVAAAKGSEASGGGMAVVEEKAQGVKPDEEAAIEATITWGVEVEPRSAKKAEDEAREGGPVGVAPEEEGACEATDLQGEEVEAGVAKVSAGESPGPKAVLFSTSYVLNAGVDSVSSLEASGGVAAGAQKPGSSLHTTEARKKRKKKKSHRDRRRQGPPTVQLIQFRRAECITRHSCWWLVRPCEMRRGWMGGKTARRPNCWWVPRSSPSNGRM